MPLLHRRVSRLSALLGFSAWLGLGALAACGPRTTSEVSGLVLDENALPIPGALVELVDGSARTYSSATGEFGISVKAGDVVLKFSADRYGRSFVRRTFVVGVEQWITAQLRAVPAAQKVTVPPVGQTVVVREGTVGLEIPGGALCDAAGKTVTGVVDITMIPYDPAKPEIFLASQMTAAGEPSYSQGMVDITIMQGGEPLVLCLGMELNYFHTLPKGAIAAGTDAVDVNYLDPKTGHWQIYTKGRFNSTTSELTTPLRTLMPHCDYEPYVPPPPPPPDPEPVYVIADVRDTRNRPALIQVGVATAAGAYYSASTNADGQCNFSLGSITPGSSIAATVAPTPLPDRRTTPVATQASYPVGTTVVRFRYCVVEGKKCSVDELCCGSTQCKDGFCSP